MFVTDALPGTQEVWKRMILLCKAAIEVGSNYHAFLTCKELGLAISP